MVLGVRHKMPRPPTSPSAFSAKLQGVNAVRSFAVHTPGGCAEENCGEASSGTHTLIDMVVRYMSGRETTLNGPVL